jgi:hypothetical protein
VPLSLCASLLPLFFFEKHSEQERRKKKRRRKERGEREKELMTSK